MLSSGPCTSAPRIVNRLEPGETLGAAGLVTGQPSTATVTVLSPLEAWGLGRDDLAAGLAENPDLSPSLNAPAERVVASMQRHAVQGEAAAPPPPKAADAFPQLRAHAQPPGSLRPRPG